MDSHELFKNIRRIQIKASRCVQDVLSGAYHSAFKGRGMEFEDVREYQVGDEVRSIDWNVTARMQYPFIKSFKEERELTVNLLIDVSASSLFGTQGKKKAELIAELGALISFSAIENNDKVGLILFSDRIEKYLPAKKGTGHAMRLIRELLAYKPAGKKTQIANALHFFGKVQKKRSVVFLISDFISPSFKDELAIVGKKHEVIGINVRDPHEISLPKLGLLRLKDLESGKSLIVDTSKKEVRDKLSHFHQNRNEQLKRQFDLNGGGWMEMRLDQPYLRTLKEFFNRRRVPR